MQNSELTNFKNKKVAVVGAGIEGLSTARFLTKKGARVYLSDEKAKEELDGLVLKESETLGGSFALGKDYLDYLEGFDFIFRSPGIKPNLPQLVEAKKKG